MEKTTIPDKNGLISCPECNGSGAVMQDYNEAKKYHIDPDTLWLCTKCYGEGKLTWLENLFGKKPRHNDLGGFQGDYEY